MIDFRYHIVSIVAVFLALAVGVTLGSTALRGPVLTNLSGNVDKLTSENQNLRSQVREQQAENNEQAAFIAKTAPALLAGRLKSEDVAVLSLPGASNDQRDAVVGYLGKAGARVTSKIRLSENFTDAKHHAEMKDLVARVLPAGVTLPETDDAVAQGAALLAAVLATSGDSNDISRSGRTSVLEAFDNLDLLTLDGTVRGPAQLVVVVGAADESSSEDEQAVPNRLTVVKQLDDAFRQSVLAAPSVQGTAVAAVRGNDDLVDSVSTVDDLDTVSGQVTAVLALIAESEGHTGQYGTGDGATLVPPLDRK